LPCCRGDGKGRGDDEPVLVIKLSPAWKGFLSICRVAPGEVGGEGHALLPASPAIPPGGEIPSQYTCDGADISPRSTWSGVPNGTKSLVLVVEDPDAPSGVFRHWAVFDIPSGSHGLDADYSANRPAKGLQEVRYGGPCPPRGHGTHHYHFRLLVISRPTLDLRPTASAADVLKTAEPYAIQRAELVGSYQP
jgi:Raf kinase inhibitor-like YbhB/YbcL family protein